MIGLGIPLFIVTMTSQNVPGIAMIQAAGYKAPVSAATGITGIATTMFAPFGAFAINLAAITAAICLGEEAHKDKQRRYVAAVCAAIFYILLGLFGASVTAIFTAFPQVLITTLAGLALFATISQGLGNAFKDEGQREPALITFLLTASGVSFFGLSAAFWGLLAGIVSHCVLTAAKK
jgi:benzoate membrane transport protein